MKIEMFEPVSMARNHKFGKAPILMLDCMISQIYCDKDILNVSVISKRKRIHNI